MAGAVAACGLLASIYRIVLFNRAELAIQRPS
jgi:hypothetical protein